MRDYTELRQLSHELIEGTLDEAGKAKLEQILLNDQQACKEYLRYSKMHSSLMHYTSEQQAFVDYMGDTSAKPKLEVLELKPRLSPQLIVALAASLLIGGFVSFFIFSNDDQPSKAGQIVESIEPQQTFSEEVNEGYATLLKTYQVDWGEGNPVFKLGDSIPKGDFKIKSGVVLIEFYTGTTMVIEGQSHLEILSADKAFCHRGKMKVTASAHAKGFTIATKDYDYVDLGTEFGLNVSPDQSPELHVFSGEVEVFEPDRKESSKPLKTQKTGEAIAMLANHQSKTIELKDDFWNAQKLIEATNELETRRFYEWEEYSKHISKSEDLVAYFPFYQTSPWVRKLENVVPLANANSHGAIVGSQWIPGRWQQKSALLFKNPSDRVRFNIEGEFDNLTLSAWVKVVSLKNKHNGLFMTDYYKPGNPHWQITQEGKLFFGVKKPEKIGQYGLLSDSIITPDFYGKWMHLAVSFEGKNSSIKHYLNGQLVSQNEPSEKAKTKVIIGKGELGNWGLRKDKPSMIRNFDGAIDELQVYQRVLNHHEIWSLYEMGSPVELLSFK